MTTLIYPFHSYSELYSNFLPIYTHQTILNDKFKDNILPFRSNVNFDFSNFHNKIEILHNLGFKYEKCQEALLSAFGNEDRAAEYLIDDDIPKTIFSNYLIKPELLINKQDLNNNLENNINDIKNLLYLGFERDFITEIYVLQNCNFELTKNLLLLLKQ